MNITAGRIRISPITGSSSSIYAGGNVVIDATTFLNRLSTVEAGGNLTVTSTSFNNQAATLLLTSWYRDTYGSYGTQWLGDHRILAVQAVRPELRGVSAATVQPEPPLFSQANAGSGWIPELDSLSANTTSVRVPVAP